jgi:hypothetical protein
MAIGDIVTVDSTGVFSFELLASAAATNSPPSGSSAGLALSTIVGRLGALPSQMTLIVRSTAGSGTMTATLKLWGYSPVAADWFPLGTGTDALKGTINVAAAIGETSADKIRHSELIYTPCHFTRVYMEITAIGGTSTAITGELVGKVVV